jgi:hypothetical protein
MIAAESQGCFQGPLNVVQKTASFILSQVRVARAKRRDEDHFLKLALIASDSYRWLPIFYPSTKSNDYDISDLMDEDGFPDLDGVTLHFADPTPPGEAEEMLKAMLQDRSGALTLDSVLQSTKINGSVSAKR